MVAATVYKNRLGIEFPDCHAVDVDRLSHPAPHDPSRPEFEEISHLLRGHPLFTIQTRFTRATIT